jgi:hypothetical protein
MPARIGDDFTLPSGRVVRVNYATHSLRPWHAVGRNAGARVCRAHWDPRAPGVEFYTEFGADVVMTFDEYDAKVFASILNTGRRFRFRAATVPMKDDIDRKVVELSSAGFFENSCTPGANRHV